MPQSSAEAGGCRFLENVSNTILEDTVSHPVRQYRNGEINMTELRFSLPIYIPSASPRSSSLSPEAGTIGQEWPQWQ
jgi:hypothetical protein